MALKKDTKEKLIKDFGQSVGDTGSSQVQVAVLTENIRVLTGHCQRNPKDFSTKRGLLRMVCRRRRFLDYLVRKNKEQYKELIKRLGLKK